MTLTSALKFSVTDFRDLLNPSPCTVCIHTEYKPVRSEQEGKVSKTAASIEDRYISVASKVYIASVRPSIASKTLLPIGPTT
jgi:hypothetical protein